MLDSSSSGPSDEPDSTTGRKDESRAAEPGREPAGRRGGIVARVNASLAHLVELAWPANARDRRWLALLVTADLIVIAAFLAYARAEHYGLRDSLFYGNVRFSFVDRGYPEIYGYAKQALIVWLMWRTYATARQPVYPALGLLFTVALLDDALTLHETLGAMLAAGGVSADVDEPAAWGLIGLVPVLLVAAAYRRSDAAARADAAAILAGFALLLFFAIGVDAAHGVVGRYVSGFQTLLTLAEDGGELFTLTLLCVVARRLPARRAALRLPREAAGPSR